MNIFTCLSFTTFTLLGFMIYQDLHRLIIPYVPIHYQSKTVPMVLVHGNWTCQSSLQTYKRVTQSSMMAPETTWWRDCSPMLPDSECQILTTWMGKEFDEDGMDWEYRYVKYMNNKMVSVDKVSLRGEGRDSYTRYLTLGEISLNDEYDKSYKLKSDQCLAQFVFRNVLNGNYFVESTYHPMMMRSWLKHVGELFQVTYLEPCNLSIFWNGFHLNNRYHCVIGLEPMNMTSYEIKNTFKN